MSTGDEEQEAAVCYAQRSDIEHMKIRPNSEEIVKLVVGPEQQVFEVGETILCDKCPFFFNAFAGNFLESQTKTFTFPDDDPQHFDDLCVWLTSGDIAKVNSTPTWIWLVKTWLFGDKYHVDELQNAIIDALHAKFAAHEEGISISFETLDYVAENTFARSPLRRIFADMLTNGISLQQLQHRIENIPPEFLQDMCLALKSNVSMNGPTNTSLLTNPISTFYSSSSACKANAQPPAPLKPADLPSDIYCDGHLCQEMGEPQPITGVLHICTNHNLKLCNSCRHGHYGHRKKMISLTSAPYKLGEASIVDGYINDSGFYCDGPRCDPDDKSVHQRWELLSGDRYHCLECHNTDYCTVCIRGELKCKEDGHAMLRIRPTHCKKVPLTEDITIKQKQDRLERNVCWRCESADHTTENCAAKEPVLAKELEVED